VKILLLTVAMLFASCAKESSEADPNLIDVPIGQGAPTTDYDVFINQEGTQPDPDTDEFLNYRIVFSRAINPATLTVSDITNSGTATGVEFELLNTGNNITFLLFTSAIATEGTVIPEIAAGVTTDSYGNQNTIFQQTDNSVTYDSQLAVIIDQKTAQADPAGSLPIEFDVTFTSAISNGSFGIGDITQNGTATGVTWVIINQGDDINYTLQANGASSGGTIIPSIAAGLVDDAGVTETNVASTSTDNTVTYNPKFDVTINQNGSQNDPASTFNIEFDVVFTEAINDSSFTTADITQNGTATGVTWSKVHVSGNTNYTIRATGASTEGTIIPSIADSLVDNGSGRTNTPSTATDNSVTYRTNFYVTIDETVAQADPTAALPIEFDVVFDQEIDPSTFTSADITQSGTATVDTWTITNTGDDTNFTLRATVASVEGTIIPTIGVGIVADKDGGASNFASTSADNSVTYDTIFDVTVDQKSGQADPTPSLPLEFSIVFSRDIDPTSFTTADITHSGTATGITWNIINLGDNTNFTLQATAGSEGTYVPSINGAIIQDPTGGNNAASTSTDNIITYGTTFDVTINQAVAQTEDPTATTNVEFDIVFSEAINPATFTTADITQNGTATGITWNIVPVAANTTFTLQATIVGTAGTIIPSIGATTIKNNGDAKDNNASTSTDNSVTWVTEFSVTLDQKSGQADPASATPVEFTVVFERAIQNATFTDADITQNGTATVDTWTVTDTGDQITYTVAATAVSVNGTIIPSIALLACSMSPLNIDSNSPAISSCSSIQHATSWTELIPSYSDKGQLPKPS